MFDPFEYLKEGDNPKKRELPTKPYAPTPLGHYDYLVPVDEAKDVYFNMDAKIVDRALKDKLLQAYGLDIALNIDWKHGINRREERALKYPDKMVKSMERLDKMRNLNFRDSRWLTPVKWTELMTIAAPTYNEFDAGKVGAAFMKFPHLSIQGARESSVCAYVKGFKTFDEIVKFAQLMKRCQVDEFTIHGLDGKVTAGYMASDIIRSFRGVEGEPTKVKEIRLWWD